MRVAAVGLAMLAACAQVPDAERMAIAVLPDVPSYTAAKGEIMVVGPSPAVESTAARYTALVFVGMRSTTEAVFERRTLDAPPGSLRETEVPGLYVPVRSGVPEREGAMLPTDVGGDEIVLKPALGALFGVDDIVLLVTDVAPGAISYQLDAFDPLAAVR